MTDGVFSASQHFRAPDEAHARALVDALVAHGFPLVLAAPDQDDWQVVACDGPYPISEAGTEAEDAISEEADEIALGHGCHTVLHVSGGAAHLLRELADPAALSARVPQARIVRINPQARPTRAAL